MQTPVALASTSQWNFPSARPEDEVEGTLSWGRRLQAENLQLREKAARLDQFLNATGSEPSEVFRNADDARHLLQRLQPAASGAPTPPKLAPTALATRRARLLLWERYPDAAHTATEAVSSPLASTRIAASSSRGRVRPIELTNPRRAAERATRSEGLNSKATLAELLEMRTEVEELRQLEAALKKENKDLSEAMNEVSDKANQQRKEAQAFRGLRRAPSPEAPPELKAVRDHVTRRREELIDLRRKVERAAVMNEAVEGLKKALKAVLPIRIAQDVLVRWYDICDHRNQNLRTQDMEVQGADVLDDSSQSPETSRSPDRRRYDDDEYGTGPKRNQSPGAKRRAEKRKQRGQQATEFNAVIGKEESAGIFGNLFGGGGTGLFGGGNTSGDTSAPVDDGETGAAWAGLRAAGAGLFGFDGTTEEVEDDDGTGEWYSAWGEEDTEDALDARKAEYAEEDKRRAKNQLAPLFAGRRGGEGGATGAQGRREARKKAAVRKKGAPGAVTAAALAPVPE